MANTKKVRAVKKEEKRFNLLLSVGEIIYEGRGDSVVEALNEITSKANKFLIKTWGIFTLREGKKKAELEMRPVQIRPILFGGRFAKDYFEKKILMRLK